MVCGRVGLAASLFTLCAHPLGSLGVCKCGRIKLAGHALRTWAGCDGRRCGCCGGVVVVGIGRGCGNTCIACRGFLGQRPGRVFGVLFRCRPPTSVCKGIVEALTLGQRTRWDGAGAGVLLGFGLSPQSSCFQGGLEVDGSTSGHAHLDVGACLGLLACAPVHGAKIKPGICIFHAMVGGLEVH